MRFPKVNILFVAIIILATLLRLIKLGTIPIGFNDDEAAFGYNAYSILKYGFDEWGRFLPFPTFESFGDWKLVFYLYLTVISQFIFGVNEFATRFPSAVFGVLTVIVTYFLTKKLFEKSVVSSHLSDVKGETIALVAMFLLAISPWHIVASRNAFESDLLSFFIAGGLYFFLKSQKEKKFLYLSTILFAVCFYIYRSSWLFVPLFIITIFYLFKKNLTISKDLIAKNLAIFALILIPLMPTVLTFKGQSRFVQESFVTGVTRIGITNQVNERRGICQSNLPQIICNLAYNKYLFFVKSYTGNYLKNLSFETFFENSSATGFQSFAKRSAFYLFELPLVVAGIFFLFKTKSTAARVLIPWILLAPVGAAATGIGNFGRINLIMPAPQIIAAASLVSLVNLIKIIKIQKLAILIVTLIIIYSFIKLTVDIFYIEPFYTSRYQRYGYKQLFEYLTERENDYDQFTISRKIDNSHQYIQYLFMQKIDPKFMQEIAQRIREKDGWVVFQSIGKFTFVPSVPGVESMTKSLLVVAENEVTYPVSPIHTIYYLNGDPGFLIYDIDQVKLKLKENEK